MNRAVVRGAAVGALGGWLFGFDTAVVSGTTAGLTQVFALSSRQLGFTVGIALVGTVLGAMSSGALESRFGGRVMLRVMALLYFVSAVGCALAPSWGALLLARFIGGVGIGGSSVLGPVYIAEISPPNLRGRLVGTFQVNIVVGVLCAYLSNYLIACWSPGLTEWRWDFFVAALPALAFAYLLFGIPESARWLAAKGRHDEALAALTTIGSPDPSGDLLKIVHSIEEDARSSSESLFQRKYRKPIFLAASIAIFNQLSGINIITYYLNYIFAAAGFSKLSSSLQAIAFGVANLTATLVGMALIDRIGRKKLLIVGAIGNGLSLAGISWIFFQRAHREWLLPLILVYICFFAVSQGVVIWVYLSEVFPTRVRGKGQALGSSTHWILNALISASFPVVAHISGGIPFAFCACMMLVQLIVVSFCYPETKNVSLEEMQSVLGIESEFAAVRSE